MPVLLYRANHKPWSVRMRVPIEIRPGRRLRATVTVDIQTFLSYFRERLKSELQTGGR